MTKRGSTDYTGRKIVSVSVLVYLFNDEEGYLEGITYADNLGVKISSLSPKWIKFVSGAPYVVVIRKENAYAPSNSFSTSCDFNLDRSCYLGCTNANNELLIINTPQQSLEEILGVSNNMLRIYTIEGWEISTTEYVKFILSKLRTVSVS